MNRNKKKLLSLLLAFSLFVTLFNCIDIKVFASENTVTVGEDEVLVLYEGFAGESKTAAPSDSSWTLTRNGQSASEIGGYSSSGNYGEESPSLGFGRAGSGVEVLESPEFTLPAEATLSFYYKRQSSGDFTSTLLIEALVNGVWQEVESPDFTEDGTYSSRIPQETTKVRFTYTKNVGNLAFDDVKIVYNINDIIASGDLNTIEEARAMSDGEEATVRGVVSFNDRDTTLHIEDSTGAIAIYKNSVDLSSIEAGDYIEVTGTRNTYKGLVQIYATEIRVVVEDKGLPTPQLLTIEELNTGNYDSKYVKIENAVFDSSAKTLTQGDDVLNIYYIPSDINVSTGDVVDVVGTMGSYSGTVQIYGSSCTFTKVEVPDLESPVITHTAIEKASINDDMEIIAEVTDNIKVSNVTLYYRTTGDTDFNSVVMDNSKSTTYIATISKDKLSLDGLEYYIVASDGSNKGKTEVYSVVISDEDMEGPSITDLTPSKGASVGTEGKPEISATYTDDSGIDTSSVKIYVDDKDVTSKSTVTDSKVKYTPGSDLDDGSHTVKVIACDKVGNESSVEWTFRKGELSHYFGQIHSHTNISDGSGSLEDAYQWVKDNGADYYIVTDHSNWFDNDTSANILDGSASTEWTTAHEIADEYNEEGVFSAMYGYEMTWSASTGGWGHINTFNTEGFETRSNSSMDLSTYYETLQSAPESISQLNHPGKTFGDFSDFAFYSEETDELVNLIEVGNGEGTIGGDGYYPSYEYYTRALDKGWHVAPTNNQDNHKGKWYTANTARTVIIAEENSRDAIYDAMRNLRVYASEDENMTIDYYVNGEIMGSTLSDEVDTLSFSIDANDPDSKDNIAEVSIIANGGVEVISKEFNSSEAKWDFELSPEYSYYYVKVVQEDGQIAVSSPIWVGESLNVGITDAEVDSELTLPNEDINMTVSVYNNTDTELNDVKIEYYENEISDDHKIGEETIASVASSGTEETTYTWKAGDTGEYTLYAKITINVDGVEKIFTTSAKVTVANPNDVYKVVIDGAHYNKYVTGYASGSYTALEELLNERNAITVINKEKITSETLEGVDLLVLTNPQSKDSTSSGWYASTFESSEVEAIEEYVKNGGNVILSTVADYGDGSGEYSNDAQINPILEAIGSEIRINDDEVIDETNNGGQSYRLYLSNYNSDKYNLIEGVENGTDLFSFYSGASIVLADGATGDNVDFLVNGFDTTTTLDSDGQGDNVEVAMGDVSVLAAEELSNGGKVVVGGSVFFSDYEAGSSNASKYSNLQITTNIVNWILPEKEVEKANIADIRIDYDNDGVPDLLGEKFVIEGYVTSQSEAVAPKNAFFEVVYVEDETGGICVFGISNTELKVGQKVRITGTIDAYQGEFEIQIADEDTDLEVLDETKEITATNVSTYDSMKAANGGKLVQIQGKVVDMDSSNLYVDDGTGISRAYVEGYIWDGVDESTKGTWDSNIEIGDTVSVIGLASMDPEGARLRVRNTGEIILVAESTEEVTDPDEDNSGESTNPGEVTNPTDEDTSIDTTTEVVDKEENTSEEVVNDETSSSEESVDSVEVNEDTDSNNDKTESKIPTTGGVNSKLYIVLGLIFISFGSYMFIKKRRVLNK